MDLNTSQDNLNQSEDGSFPERADIESAPAFEDDSSFPEPESETAGGGEAFMVAVMERRQGNGESAVDSGQLTRPAMEDSSDDLSGELKAEDLPGTELKIQEHAEEFAEPSPIHLKGRALKAYSHQTRQVREDQLIVEYLPLVHRIVQQVTLYLQPPLSREDLVSAGTIGLVKAARDYDPVHQTEFKTYAYIRIRGAVLDELRSWSFAPSNLKKQFDQAQQVMQEMTDDDGELPSDSDLADKLQMPVDKMYRMFENARARHFLSIHGLSDEAPALGESLAAHGDEPGEALQQQELIEQLARAIQKLPTKQRRIIILYYTRELTMKQIATTMEITESRVSQLHAAALGKLASRLKGWRDSMD